MSYLLIKLRARKNLIEVYGRDENLEKHKFMDGSFKPYFYVPDKLGTYLGYDGIKLRKMYVETPDQVPKLRQTFNKHYEADIPYTDRYMIDRNLFSGFEFKDGRIVPCEPPKGVKPRLVIFDIEVEAEGSIPDINDPRQPVTSVSLWDSYTGYYATLHTLWEGKEKRGNWFIYGFGEEREMLKAFISFLGRLQPDILTGWYAIGGEFDDTGFDLPYLQNRLPRLGLPRLDFSGTQLIDTMYCFKRFIRCSSWKLKDVAEAVGYDLRYGRSFDAVKDDPEALLKYNWQDVDIIRWMEEKYRAIAFHWNLKCMAGLNNLRDTLSNLRLVDVMYLREAKRCGIVLPSKIKHAEEGGIRGAVVFEPIKGIHEYVGVFDFSRYYPSIIISLNLSPEGKGLFPNMVKKLLELRSKIEEEMKNYEPGSEDYEILESKSNAVKFLTNSIYGVLGHSGFRLYRRDIAEKITETARIGLLAIRKFVEEKGFKVVYGDTDSIMIKLEGDDLDSRIEFGTKLCEEINRFVKEYFVRELGAENPAVKLKFERVFERVLFTGAKKRYAGKVVWEKGQKCDYFLYRGFEVVRTDQSEATRELQTKVMELILSGAGREELKIFIRKFLEDYRKKSLKEIAIVKGIRKRLDQYRAMPPHVRGALYSNMHFGTDFKGGDSVHMVYVKRVPGYPPTDVICFDLDSLNRLPEGIEVDWERMIETTVKSKVEELLGLVGLSWSGVFAPKSLEEYL